MSELRRRIVQQRKSYNTIPVRVKYTAGDSRNTKITFYYQNETITYTGVDIDIVYYACDFLSYVVGVAGQYNHYRVLATCDVIRDGRLIKAGEVIDENYGREAYEFEFGLISEIPSSTIATCETTGADNSVGTFVYNGNTETITLNVDLTLYQSKLVFNDLVLVIYNVDAQNGWNFVFNTNTKFNGEYFANGSASPVYGRRTARSFVFEFFNS